MGWYEKFNWDARTPDYSRWDEYKKVEEENRKIKEAYARQEEEVKRAEAEQKEAQKLPNRIKNLIKSVPGAADYAVKNPKGAADKTADFVLWARKGMKEFGADVGKTEGSTKAVNNALKNYQAQMAKLKNAKTKEEKKQIIEHANRFLKIAKDFSGEAEETGKKFTTKRAAGLGLSVAADAGTAATAVLGAAGPATAVKAAQSAKSAQTAQKTLQTILKSKEGKALLKENPQALINLVRTSNPKAVNYIAKNSKASLGGYNALNPYKLAAVEGGSAGFAGGFGEGMANDANFVDSLKAGAIGAATMGGTMAGIPMLGAAGRKIAAKIRGGEKLLPAEQAVLRDLRRGGSGDPHDLGFINQGGGARTSVESAQGYGDRLLREQAEIGAKIDAERAAAGQSMRSAYDESPLLLEAPKTSDRRQGAIDFVTRGGDKKAIPEGNKAYIDSQTIKLPGRVVPTTPVKELKGKLNARSKNIVEKGNAKLDLAEAMTEKPSSFIVSDARSNPSTKNVLERIQGAKKDTQLAAQGLDEIEMLKGEYDQAISDAIVKSGWTPKDGPIAFEMAKAKILKQPGMKSVDDFAAAKVGGETKRTVSREAKITAPVSYSGKNKLTSAQQKAKQDFLTQKKLKENADMLTPEETLTNMNAPGAENNLLSGTKRERPIYSTVDDLINDQTVDDIIPEEAVLAQTDEVIAPQVKPEVRKEISPEIDKLIEGLRKRGIEMPEGWKPEKSINNKNSYSMIAEELDNAAPGSRKSLLEREDIGMVKKPPMSGTKILKSLGTAKWVSSPETVFSLMGDAGQKFIYGLRKAIIAEGKYKNHFSKNIKDMISDMGDDRLRAAFNMIEDPNIRPEMYTRDASQVKMLFDTMREEANKFGLNIEYRDNYVPHLVDPRSRNQFMTYLQENGMSSAEAADVSYNAIFKVQRTKTAPEFARVGEIPPEFRLQDPKEIMASYNEMLSKASGQAAAFGPEMEDWAPLVEKMVTSVPEVNNMPGMSDFIARFEQLYKYGLDDKGHALKATRRYQVLTKMAGAGITNVGQTANTGILTGVTNTAKAIRRIASNPEDARHAKELLANIGDPGNDLYTRIVDGLSRETNAADKLGAKAAEGLLTLNGFKWVERKNREIAALATEQLLEKMQAKNVLTKADKRKLTLLGLNKISKGADLTPEDMNMGIRQGVALSQFYTDPKDIMLWTNAGEIGKTVSQLNVFSIKQSEFIKEVMVREAVSAFKEGDYAKGLLPIARAISLLPAGAGLEWIRYQGIMKAYNTATGSNVEGQHPAHTLDTFNDAEGLGKVAEAYKWAFEKSQRLGGFGYVPGVIEGAQYSDSTLGGLVKGFVGPTGNDIMTFGDIADLAIRKGEYDKAGEKFFKEGTKRIPLVGPWLKQGLYPYDPEISQTRDTLKKVGLEDLSGEDISEYNNARRSGEDLSSTVVAQKIAGIAYDDEGNLRDADNKKRINQDRLSKALELMKKLGIDHDAALRAKVELRERRAEEKARLIEQERDYLYDNRGEEEIERLMEEDSYDPSEEFLEYLRNYY